MLHEHLNTTTGHFGGSRQWRVIVPSVALFIFKFPHSLAIPTASSYILPSFLSHIDPYLLPSPQFVLCKQMQLPWWSNEPLSGHHGCYRSEFTFLLAESHTKIGGEGEERGMECQNQITVWYAFSITWFLIGIRRLSASPTLCLHTLSFSHIHLHTHTLTKWLMFRISPTPVISQCSVISSLFLNGLLNVLQVRSAV